MTDSKTTPAKAAGKPIAAKATAPRAEGTSQPDEAGAVDTPTGPVRPSGSVSAAAKGNIFIELQRNLHGWGRMFEILEVDPGNAEVQGLLDNEHAVKVAKKDLVPDPGVAEQVTEPQV